jgi:adenylate cyclase
MAEVDVTRRLTTIVAADVAEYSRLTAADEEGTFAELRSHRADLIDPKIAEYRGRIANTAGDSLLIEFPSVVEALRCLIDVQDAMVERNADVPEHRRIAFRVGINLGDVIEQDGDLLGDGVNVAARLEGLADPGGICLSRAARDQVRDRLDISLQDMGEVEVKNIARPVRAFRVLRDGEAPAISSRQPPTMNLLAAAFVVMLIAIVGGGTWWWQTQQPDFDPADPAKMTFTLPEKPSIAVLPFDNLSSGKEHEHLADGLTESIITGLSNLQDVFVIARNSTFTYKGKAVKVQQVAEEFGVRYVLEGSIQVSGEALRINAQLIDAVSGTHLWAQQYDRKRGDFFALQDDITKRVLEAMQVKLTTGQQARIWHGQTKNLEAYLLMFQGLETYWLFQKDNNTEARRLFNEAVALDETFAGPWVLIGWTHWRDAISGWSASREASLAEAENAARQALARDEDYSNPHALLSAVALERRQYDLVVSHCEEAVSRRPTTAATLATCAEHFALAGLEPEKSVELINRAMRMSPIFPVWYIPVAITANWLAGNRDTAIANGRLLEERRPQWSATSYTFIAIIHAEAGDLDSARLETAKILKRMPKMTSKSLVEKFWIGGRFKDDAIRLRMIQALQSAGLPE